MSDQPGSEENGPAESEYEPATPPAPMAYDEALAAARRADAARTEPAEPRQPDTEPEPEPVAPPTAGAAEREPAAEKPEPPEPAAEAPEEPEAAAAEPKATAEEPAPETAESEEPADEPEPPEPPAEAPEEPAAAAAAEPAATAEEPKAPEAPEAPGEQPRTPVALWLGRQPELTDTEEEPPARPHHHRRRRLLIGALIALFALGACAVSGVWWLSERYAGQVRRIPQVFDQIPEQERPDKPAEAAGTLNFLLAGTDRRSEVATTGEQATADAWLPGAQRSDTIILVHLSADRKRAYVISFPRDSWVEIPGHGLDKINAAFSLGGPSLYVRTLEHLTGIRIDHLAIIDWEGFIGLTNALGGVDVTIPQTTHDFHNNRTWVAGQYHLNGTDALAYVRQRYGLPRGDFDRVQRQQNFLREIMRKTLGTGMMSNPLRLARVLDAVTRTVSVDDTLSNSELRNLALSLRNIRQRNVVFMTVPTTGTGYEGAASVVYLDERRARRLFDAIKQDDIDSYLTRFGRPDERLGSTTS